MINSNIAPLSFTDDEGKKLMVFDNDINLDLNKSKNYERKAANRRMPSLPTSEPSIEINVLNIMPTLQTEQELNTFEENDVSRYVNQIL
jgi:hypothetical protein